jgi:ABC-type transport system involved in multi-copper enzyme maturation permease subunit
MNAKLQMLLWAEWRQRRAQFLICLLWMVCGTVYGVAYELSTGFRAPVASFYTTAALFGLFMPIFVAMRTSLGEKTDGTKAFSDGLPISGRRRGWTRLTGGAAVLIAPIVVGALMLSAYLAFGWIEQAPPRPHQGAAYIPMLDRPSLSAISAVGFLWQVTAVVAWSAGALYLVLSLLGTALRAESHAGFAGTAVAAVWLMAGFLGAVFEDAHLPRVAEWIGAIAPQSMIINYGYGHARGSYGDLEISDLVIGPLLVNAALQLGLGAIFVRRYSRMLPRRIAEKPCDSAPRVWRRWTLPLPTRTIALAWLALRQSVPMCIPGLLIACLMAPFQLNGDYSAPTLPQRLVDALPSTMFIVGLVWAVVVGAGTFAAEIDLKIGEFWRTLPIATWRLFAVKFFAGLLVVLLVLDGSIIAASWHSPNWGNYHAMNWPYIACFLPLHATMFAIAVAWTCVLRRAVLGGMAAIVTFALVNLALDWLRAFSDFDPISVYNNLSIKTQLAPQPLDFTAHNYPVVATAMGLVLLASIVVGWLALRRYNPRRQIG